MFKSAQVVETITLEAHQLDEQLPKWSSPKIIKGLVSDWPVVQADKQGQLVDYLKSFCTERIFNVVVASAEVNGRFFYDQQMSGFNFGRRQARVGEVLTQLVKLQQYDGAKPSIYLGSTSVEQCLPGFLAAQNLPLDEYNPLISAWLGNQTRIAAHFDAVDNIACVAGGKRRFTLFAPEKVENLYIGPSDFTPAGQAISLVDFAKPDLVKFPRFSQAIEQSWVAELECGDGLFIPAMWWHHVESLSAVNLLINYWWRSTPRRLGEPMDAFRHGLLSIKSLPLAQKRAWQQLFEHYIFCQDDTHLARLGRIVVHGCM